MHTAAPRKHSPSHAVRLKSVDDLREKQQTCWETCRIHRPAWHLILQGRHFLSRRTRLETTHFHASGNCKSPRKWHHRTNCFLCVGKKKLDSRKMQIIKHLQINSKSYRQSILCLKTNPYFTNSQQRAEQDRSEKILHLNCFLTAEAKMQ